VRTVKLDPAHGEWLRGVFAAQAFPRHLGIELGGFADGSCELILAHRPEFDQHTGVIHAGVVSTLADNAAGGAASTRMAKGSAAVTVEFKINFLAPATGERLIARAQVKHAGRRLAVCGSEVYSVAGSAETLCAVALVTLAPVAVGG
jgi:uncharacterized protein (TIGR00369 family)